MVWTTIPSGDLDPESPLTTSLMNALYDNVAAALNQDSGAPAPGADFITAASQLGAGVVGQSELGANAVHTSELAESTGSASYSANFDNDFTMSGGLYCFHPQIRTGNATYAAVIWGSDGSASTTSTSFLTRMNLGRVSGAYTAYMQWYYVSSSPPYDLGDGICSTFIFAVVDNASGEIEAVIMAQDPPWVHNGPTNCLPDVVGKDRVPRKWIRDLSGIPAGLNQSEYMRAVLNAPRILQPIPQSLKHADMNIIPHPWHDTDLTGKTVVLIDPVGDLTLDLAELHQTGESVNDLFHDGHIIVGNQSLGRCCPDGVLDVGIRWRNTARR